MHNIDQRYAHIFLTRKIILHLVHHHTALLSQLCIQCFSMGAFNLNHVFCMWFRQQFRQYAPLERSIIIIFHIDPIEGAFSPPTGSTGDIFPFARCPMKWCYLFKSERTDLSILRKRMRTDPGKTCSGINSSPFFTHYDQQGSVCICIPIHSSPSNHCYIPSQSILSRIPLDGPFQ